MSLKITPEDLSRLGAAIALVDSPQARQRYIDGDFVRAAATRDLDKRYRWDLLHACGLKIGDGCGAPGDLDLYAYLNDDHIDSALRHLVAPLKAPLQRDAGDPGDPGEPGQGHEAATPIPSKALRP